ARRRHRRRAPRSGVHHPPKGAAVEHRPPARPLPPRRPPVDRPVVDAAVSAPPRASTGLRVALFATCFNDTMWPETLKATVRLLERLGCEVEFPMEQTCCGQMHTNTGYGKDALPLVRRFADVFEEYDAAVAPSGSCVGSVREQHGTIAEKAGD